MKAISPVLPLRRNHVTALSHDLGVSRTKSAWEEPLGVMCDMNDCYSRLKELVPSLPQDRSVSKMEILQHVIDYILDLQIALDSSSTAQNTESSVSADPRTVSSQPSNFLREAQTDDHITVSR